MFIFKNSLQYTVLYTIKLLYSIFINETHTLVTMIVHTCVASDGTHVCGERWCTCGCVVVGGGRDGCVVVGGGRGVCVVVAMGA